MMSKLIVTGRKLLDSLQVLALVRLCRTMVTTLVQIYNS
jgi:hypothetical protein